MEIQNHLVYTSKPTDAIHETFCLNELKREMKIYAEKELEKMGRSHVKVEIFKDYYIEKYWVHTDRKLLRQIFMILLDSAVKHTDRGCILFDFHISFISPICNNVSFFIDDTGRGYYNENDSNYLIAHGLIQKLGGKMEVESSEDAGISVKFNIECMPCEVSEN